MMSADYLRHAPDLSDLDRGIIEVLQRDGRRPFSHLARDVGVTEKTARRRTHALLDAGVIHITAITDPRTLGYRSAALAGITLDGSGAAGDVAAALTRIDALDYVVVSAGRYAVFAELFCRDLADLREVVDRRIRTTPGVAG